MTATIKAYARQAKNKSLEADAFEIRVRAERRVSQMMVAQPKARGGGDRRAPITGFPKNPMVYPRSPTSRFRARCRDATLIEARCNGLH
jgi:hypothetical protein